MRARGRSVRRAATARVSGAANRFGGGNGGHRCRHQHQKTAVFEPRANEQYRGKIPRGGQPADNFVRTRNAGRLRQFGGGHAGLRRDEENLRPSAHYFRRDPLIAAARKRCGGIGRTAGAGVGFGFGRHGNGVGRSVFGKPRKSESGTLRRSERVAAGATGSLFAAREGGGRNR